MNVTLWGTRGSLATPGAETARYGGNTSCVGVIGDEGTVLVLDANYTNNSRSLAPQTAEASLKWALSWMVWLQQLMLSYGFFA